MIRYNFFVLVINRVQTQTYMQLFMIRYSIFVSVSHTTHSSEDIDKLHSQFSVDYPNGGIFRKYVQGKP